MQVDELLVAAEIGYVEAYRDSTFGHSLFAPGVEHLSRFHGDLLAGLLVRTISGGQQNSNKSHEQVEDAIFACEDLLSTIEKVVEALRKRHRVEKAEYRRKGREYAPRSKEKKRSLDTVLE